MGDPSQTSVAEDFLDEEEEWAEPFECSERKIWMSVSKDRANSEAIEARKELRLQKHERTIIHFDIDCFYAQVEMLRNPELKHKALGIQQKNIVVTCNYVARQYGVTKLMYVTDALKKCPQLVLVCGEDLTCYRHMSYQISEFMKKYTPHVERLGFDENFVDVSELVGWRQTDGDVKPEFNGHVYQSEGDTNSQKCKCGCAQRIQIGSQIAADIRKALQIELGITCCAGIAHNKLLAKLVAGTHKPNQQTSILPHCAQDLVLSLPSTRSIPGIGSKMYKRILALGISSIKDLQTADHELLNKEFGSQTANLLSQLSFGVDPSPVVPFAPSQTFSDEDSFKCCKDYQDAERRITGLLNNLMKRVVEDGRVPQTVRLTIRRVGNHSNSRESRQNAVPGNVFSHFHVTGSTETAEKRMLPVVMNLFKKLVEPSRPFHLTLINVCFAKLVKQGSNSGLLRQFFKQDPSAAQNSDQMPTGNCGDMIPSEDELGMIDNVDQSESGYDVSNAHNHSKDRDFLQKGNVSKTGRDQLSLSPKAQPLLNFFNRRAEVKRALNENYSFNELDERDNTECDVQNGNNSSQCEDSLFSAVPSTPASPLKSYDEIGPSDACLSHNSTSHSSDVLIGETPHQSVSSSAQRDQGVASNAERNLTQDSLRDFLPESVDAQVIMELPFSIQKEILAQHGILVEESPAARKFSIMSSAVVTRSQGRKAESQSHRKRPLFSPRKTPESNKSYFKGIKKVKEEDNRDMTVSAEKCSELQSKSNKSSLEAESNVQIGDRMDSRESNCLDNVSQGLTNVVLQNSEILLLEKAEHSGEAQSPLHQSESENIWESTKGDRDKHEPEPTQKHHHNCLVSGAHCSKSSSNVKENPVLMTHPNLKSLPKDINPEVFAALPRDIRGEIMAHVLMGTPVTVATGVSTSGSSVSRKASTCKPSTTAKKQGTGTSSSQKSLLSYFVKKDT